MLLAKTNEDRTTIRKALCVIMAISLNNALAKKLNIVDIHCNYFFYLNKKITLDIFCNAPIPHRLTHRLRLREVQYLSHLPAVQSTDERRLFNNSQRSSISRRIAFQLNHSKWCFLWPLWSFFANCFRKRVHWTCPEIRNRKHHFGWANWNAIPFKMELLRKLLNKRRSSTVPVADVHKLRS